MPVTFKPEHSLNLSPALYFEPRFTLSITNGYDRKAKACSPLTSCFYFISYTQSISDNLQLSQWQTDLKMYSLTKTLVGQNISVTELEQTPFSLKSDLNINNFTVLLYFLIT